MSELPLPADVAASTPPKVLVLACGALARELLAIVAADGLTNVVVECLPASLHHTPAAIGPALRHRLSAVAGNFDRIVVGYADCGTVGEVDEVCTEFDALRLPGEHCFEFYAGHSVYGQMQDAEPGTFYLTDFLARHFDLFVMDQLGITAHPELEELYFGNYRRMIYLSQEATPDLIGRARTAAERLGLDFQHRPSGFGELQPVLVEIGVRTSTRSWPSQSDLELVAGRP